eukprot:CAMPEP_0174229396 /NCGR_PEP_ID=MMETSP0417-20130205/386_1 /TAXON_ID=242541 /ORGANISM="Mayorella sp, Strain BSH-02190019" /LENGTH=487 /DNA_ID=CAMNT_0015306941 /DNA_START=387 /DNA_END=1850 /DNA_ORIENTATION=+
MMDRDSIEASDRADGKSAAFVTESYGDGGGAGGMRVRVPSFARRSGVSRAHTKPHSSLSSESTSSAARSVSKHEYHTGSDGAATIAAAQHDRRSGAETRSGVNATGSRPARASRSRKRDSQRSPAHDDDDDDDDEAEEAGGCHSACASRGGGKCYEDASAVESVHHGQQLSHAVCSPPRSKTASTTHSAVALLPEADRAALIARLCAEHDTIRFLKSPHGGDVILIGTAHVSKESARLVRECVAAIQPNVVMLELCSARAGMLTSSEDQSDIAPVTLSDVMTGLKQGNGFASILSYFYQDITKKLKVVPGVEFRAAFQAARDIPGCAVVLGDRLISITCQRTWALTSNLDRLKLIVELFLSMFVSISEEEVEKLKSSDLLGQLIEEFSARYPNMKRTIVTERDQYMACLLRSIQAPVIVGVVGAGHLDGIEAHWQADINMQQLTSMPTGAESCGRHFILMMRTIAFLVLGLLLLLVYLLFTLVAGLF